MPSQPPEDDPLHALREAIADLAQRLGAIETRLARIEKARGESLLIDQGAAPPPEHADKPSEALPKELAQEPAKPPEEAKPPTEGFLIAEVIDPSAPEDSASLDHLAAKSKQRRETEREKKQRLAPADEKPAPTSTPTSTPTPTQPTSPFAPQPPSSPQHPPQTPVPGTGERARKKTRAATAPSSELALVAKIRDRFSMLLPTEDESWETWLGSRGLALIGSIVVILAIGFAVP